MPGSLFLATAVNSISERPQCQHTYTRQLAWFPFHQTHQHIGLLTVITAVHFFLYAVQTSQRTDRNAHPAQPVVVYPVSPHFFQRCANKCTSQGI